MKEEILSLVTAKRAEYKYAKALCLSFLGENSDGSVLLL